MRKSLISQKWLTSSFPFLSSVRICPFSLHCNKSRTSLSHHITFKYKISWLKWVVSEYLWSAIQFCLSYDDITNFTVTTYLAKTSHRRVELINGTIKTFHLVNSFNRYSSLFEYLVAHLSKRVAAFQGNQDLLLAFEVLVLL